MNLDSTFFVNDRDVIAESVEGETLIINLNTGVYYSSDKAGDEIWRHLKDGHSIAQVVDALSARHNTDNGAIREEVLAFVTRLNEEGLIVETDGVAPNDAALENLNDAAEFVKPELKRYTDFQELLLLDPIHEVHEPSGWPVQKPDSSA